MCFARLKEKGVARLYIRDSVPVPDFSVPGNDQIKLRFRGVSVIGTERFAPGNSHQRQVKRMPLRQIQRPWLASQRNGNVLRESPKLSPGRLALLLRHIFQVHFAHRHLLTGCLPRKRAKNGSAWRSSKDLLSSCVASNPHVFFRRTMENTAIPAQITFTKVEG